MFLVDKYNESLRIASCLVWGHERYYLTVQFGHLSGQGDIRTAEQRSTTAGLLASLITVSDLQEQFLQPLLLYNNTCQYFTREDCIIKATVHPKKKNISSFTPTWIKTHKTFVLLWNTSILGKPERCMTLHWKFLRTKLLKHFKKYI